MNISNVNRLHLKAMDEVGVVDDSTMFVNLPWVSKRLTDEITESLINYLCGTPSPGVINSGLGK